MERERWRERQAKIFAALKEVRKNSGQTQEKLAEKLDRPQSYVSKYEAGERRLDLLEISEICKACDISLHDFIDLVSPL